MTKHHFVITHAHEAAGFGVILACAGCQDQEPVSNNSYVWAGVSGNVIFDPPNPGDTEATVAQLLNFLAQHNAFGLPECGHKQHKHKESVKIGESTISLWGQAE
jgi:hypothetical protein